MWRFENAYVLMSIKVPRGVEKLKFLFLCYLELNCYRYLIKCQKKFISKKTIQKAFFLFLSPCKFFTFSLKRRSLLVFAKQFIYLTLFCMGGKFTPPPPPTNLFPLTPEICAVWCWNLVTFSIDLLHILLPIFMVLSYPDP